MAYPSDIIRTKNWGTEILTDTDLEGQFDVTNTWLDAFADETTGHSHDGTANEGPKIALASCVSGTLPLANGGTGQTTLAAFLNLIYPVGSLYFNVAVATNPGTLLGFGTWEAFAAGKMIIGLDGTDTDFDGLADTGGAKEVTLTTTELPAHTHTVKLNASAGAVSSIGAGEASTDGSSGYATSSAGTGSAFSILNPYVIAYIWKRTA